MKDVYYPGMERVLQGRIKDLERQLKQAIAAGCPCSRHQAILQQAQDVLAESVVYYPPGQIGRENKIIL